MDLFLWSCCALLLWIRNSNKHSGWERGVNSWHSGMSYSSRNQENLCTAVLCQPLGGLQHHWKKSVSAFQGLEEDRPRLSVMSFSVSTSKSKLDQDHTCTKDNHPQQGSTGMSFVDKEVCYFHVHLFLTYELSASSAVWNNCNFPSSTY